jgi:predicted RNase H-like nuclease (RuvC/YqgF family)
MVEQLDSKDAEILKLKRDLKASESINEQLSKHIECITSKVEQKMYTRDEVKQLCEYAFKAGAIVDLNLDLNENDTMQTICDRWIRENIK